MKESATSKSGNIGTKIGHKKPRLCMKKSMPTNKENDGPGEFVSGEDFDFSKPIGSPYINSPSLTGPMTR